MQNISKYTTSRHLFLPRQLLNSSIYRDIKEEKILSDKILKFLSKPSNSRLLNNYSYQTIFHIQQKYPTLCSLFLMNNKLHDRIFERNFSTSSSARNNDDKSKSSSEKGPKDPDQDQRKNANDQRAAVIKLFIVSAFIYGLFVYPLRRLGGGGGGGGGDTGETVTPFISWNEFVHQMLAKGEVQEIIVKPEMDWVTVVLYEGAVVKGNKTKMRVYHMIVADATKLEEKLREAEHSLGVKEGHGVPIVYDRGTGMFEIGFMIAAVGYLLFMMIKNKGTSKFLPKDLFGSMTRAKYTLVDPLTGGGRGVKFSDVAGLKEAKIEVMEVVDYLKRPEHYKTLGAKVPKGALLLGPPGCGKTMLAKAVATEANVPFLSMNGSEFIEMIGGLGAARVRDLFKECRKRSPSILYIDEIDAIGKKRSGSGSSSDATSSRGTSESEQTLNQLLVEMDGMASKDGVIVIASTNRAEVLDKALLRPGRFDRHILIDLPTLQERKEIFERHLKSIILDKKPENYSPRLAQLTPGFSGADIANICNEAALHAARFVKKSVDSNDLSYAIDRVLCGPEKKDHGVSPTEKKIVAYHEAGHALVAWLLEETDALLKVTIKPRTRGALGFAQYTPTERKNYSKELLIETMCTALGGRAAENIIFKRCTTGAQSDLDRVTKIAYALVRQFGMSKEVGLLSFTEEETSLSQKKPFSKKLKNVMDAEVRQIVGAAYRRTEKILNDNLDKLEMIAEALLKQETLTYEEVEAMIGPPPFGQKKKVDFIDIDVPVAASVETSSDASSSSSSSNS